MGWQADKKVYNIASSAVSVQKYTKIQNKTKHTHKKNRVGVLYSFSHSSS